MVNLDPLDARKARGAFFTPPQICRFLAAWAIRSSNDRVLEPSCGEAAFLTAAGERLAELGAAHASEQIHSFGQVQGVELHDVSAVMAAGLTADVGVNATIHVGDFFEFEASEPFTAVLGNPPYVRYQDFTGQSRRVAQERALAQGVALSGLASSWAAFVVHATEFLAPDGRMGLVLPAELLSVNYAGPVRRFLLERFASVQLVLFEERVFPEVMEEVVLLLAEGSGGTDRFTVRQLHDLANLADLDRTPVTWSPADPTGKWMPALLPPAAADVYAGLLTDGSFVPLSDWGDPYLGMVTGNNKSFCLTADHARTLGLTAADLLPICPPGSAHLRGLSFTERAHADMVAAGARGFLFYPHDDTPAGATAAYIDNLHRANVHRGYKCRIRSPWWRVPLVDPPDLFLTYMNHDTPRLTRNTAGVRHVNSIHGVKLRPGRRQVGVSNLPIGSLNSLTLLGAELVGRSYGGGMLKLEPREASLLPVPSHARLAEVPDGLRSIRPQVGTMLRSGRLLDAVDLVDNVLLVDAGGMARADVRALRDARNQLFERRQARN